MGLFKSFQPKPGLHSRIEWLGDSHFKINATEFELNPRMDPSRHNKGRMCLAKHRHYLDAYVEHVNLSTVRNIVELGFFRGGSAAFFNELMGPDKIVSIDSKSEISEEFRSYLARDPKCRNTVSVHTATLQDDREKLRSIIDHEFNGEPLDLVVDDCSHRYDATKASFEVLFPHLSPHGVYVIEDWGWAHTMRDDISRLDDKALTNLMFELLMLSVSQPRWISKIVTLPFIAFVFSGPDKPTQGFSLSDSYSSHDRLLTQV